MKPFTVLVLLACFFLNPYEFPLPLYKDGVRKPSSLFAPSVKDDKQAFEEIKNSVIRKDYGRAKTQIEFFQNHFSYSAHKEKVFFLRLFIAIEQKSSEVEELFKSMEKQYARSSFFYKACLLMSQKYVKENQKRKAELLIRKVIKESQDSQITQEAYGMLNSL